MGFRKRKQAVNVFFILVFFGATGWSANSDTLNHRTSFPDYTHAASPDCAPFFGDTECKSCNRPAKSLKDQIKAVSEPAWQYSFAKRLRRRFLLRLAAVFQQQTALNKLMGGQAPSLSELEVQCKACDAEERTYTKTLFGIAGKNGEKKGAQWAVRGNDTSELYQRRLALALAEQSLIYGQLTLASPELSRGAKAKLEELNEAYPPLRGPDAAELGTRILKNVVPSHLASTFWNRNSYGVDATALKFMAREDDDDVAPAANRFLFPILEQDGGLPRFPKNFESMSWRSEALYRIMTRPLSAEVKSIVKQAQERYLNLNFQAARHLCEMSACELAHVDDATTAGLVASEGGDANSGALDKMFLCNKCAKDDKTNWGKFKNSYLNTLLTATSMGATVLCLTAPPYPCYISVGLSVISLARNNPLGAYKDYQRNVNFLSAGLVTSEEANASLVKLQSATMQSALSLVSLVSGSLDLADVLGQFREVEDAGKVISSIDYVALPRALRNIGSPEDVAEAMVTAAGRDPKMRLDLVRLGHHADIAEDSHRVIINFLRQHVGELERTVQLREHAGQITFGSAYDLALSTINLASQTAQELKTSKTRKKTGKFN